tara:strand:+ start:697 stop:864 length:168 start_codon:yes stop_codon:yes gene_type:complete
MEMTLAKKLQQTLNAVLQQALEAEHAFTDPETKEEIREILNASKSLQIRFRGLLK